MGGRNGRAESVDQRGDSSTEEASSPSFHVQRPQLLHVQLPQLWAGVHSTVPERELDEKIPAHRDQKSNSRNSCKKRKIRQQAEAAQDL